MRRVGVITFHASYNFGSVMQAWSTQEIVKELGYDCEIINFRMDSQKEKYSIFPLHGGIKLVARNILQIQYIGQKYKSNKKYEYFINNHLPITKEVNSKQELESINKYEIYLAGSDQIWGYSIPEFVSAKQDVRGVYYFDFVEGYKISYASSTGIATYEELKLYKKYIDKFSYISVREESGKEIIEKISNKKVETVLDPTFLITHERWKKIAEKNKRICDEDYILIYSLQGRKKAKKWKQLIEKIEHKSRIEIVTVVPFSPIVGGEICNRADAGPEEILNLFANAKYIFTDTFHGMSFSIHFRKSFTLFEDIEADYRKRNVLRMLELEDRETNVVENCIDMLKKHIDYNIREYMIKDEIEKSRDYLEHALAGYELKK